MARLTNAKKPANTIRLGDITFHQPGEVGDSRYQTMRKPSARFAHTSHPETGAHITVRLEPSNEELIAYHLHELQRISGRTYQEAGYLDAFA